MARPSLVRAVPTVELSVAATSEELETLAAAAQRSHMSLKDYLRLQLVAVAKLAAKAERAQLQQVEPAPAPATNLSTAPLGARPQPAFLP